MQYDARSILVCGAGFLLLASLVSACSGDGTPPPVQLPPLELVVREPDSGAGPMTAGDSVDFRGVARTEDLGTLPPDSVWWTVDGELLGRGYSVRTVLPAGDHLFSFHARMGSRSGVARGGVVVMPPRPVVPGELLWKVSVGAGHIVGGLSMGPDGTLYTVAGDASSVVAMDPRDGSVIWETDTGYFVGLTSPPAVTPDGSVYIGAWPFGDAALIALGQKGQIRWVLRGDDAFPGESTFGYTMGGVAVDEAGMLYLGATDDRSPFMSVGPDGVVRWTAMAPDSVNYGLWSGPVLSSGRVFMLERKRDLVAYDLTSGGELWRLEVLPPGLSGYQNFPAVLGDGTLVLARDRFLWAISPQGDVLWKTELAGEWDGIDVMGASPTVSSDRIHVMNSEGGVELYSLQGGFLEAWGPPRGRRYRGTPVLGAGGVVYAMGSPESGGSGFLKSYAPDGTLRFEVDLPDHRANDFVDTGSPVVGDTGILYLRTSAGTVLAVGDTVGPAVNAQWPELRGGPSRLGRRQPR